MIVVRAAFPVILIVGLLAAPLAAEAQQQAGNVYRLGYLGHNSLAALQDLIDAFRLGLREHGWIEGQNIVIEYRWAEGRSERLPGLVDESIRAKVDVLIVPLDLPPSSRSARPRPFLS